MTGSISVGSHLLFLLKYIYLNFKNPWNAFQRAMFSVACCWKTRQCLWQSSGLSHCERRTSSSITRRERQRVNTKQREATESVKERRLGVGENKMKSERHGRKNMERWARRYGTLLRKMIGSRAWYEGESGWRGGGIQKQMVLKRRGSGGVKRWSETQDGSAADGNCRWLVT